MVTVIKNFNQIFEFDFIEQIKYNISYAKKGYKQSI